MSIHPSKRKFWLLKSEPATWSWQNQLDAKTTHWDGVRNYQASNYLKSMDLGDLAFFYHSGEAQRMVSKDPSLNSSSTPVKSIVGIVQIIKTYYPDPSDETGRFGMVDVQTFGSLPRPIPLSLIKADDALQNLALIRQSRLSVMPIPAHLWDHLLTLGHFSFEKQLS